MGFYCSILLGYMSVYRHNNLVALAPCGRVVEITFMTQCYGENIKMKHQNVLNRAIHSYKLFCYNTHLTKSSCHLSLKADISYFFNDCGNEPYTISKCRDSMINIMKMVTMHPLHIPSTGIATQPHFPYQEHFKRKNSLK